MTQNLFFFKKPLTHSTIFAAMLAFAAGPVAAASIQTLAEAHFEGVDASDPQGPASVGSLSSSVSASGGNADAFQDINGVAAVRVDGGSANGQPGNTLLARSTWSDTITNTSAIAQHYVASLSIPQIVLHISGSGFSLVPGDQLKSSYAITLDINGLDKFTSSALLHSGNPGHVLEVAGTDLGGVKDANAIRYTFAPFTGSLDLGTFAPNASFVATYRLESAIDIPGFEVFADSRIGDPLAINGNGTAITITSSPVPLPGGLSLLLSGIAAIGRGKRGRVSA